MYVIAEGDLGTTVALIVAGIFVGVMLLGFLITAIVWFIDAMSSGK